MPVKKAPPRDERDHLETPGPVVPGPGEGRNRRREMPMTRHVRRSVVEANVGDTEESIVNLTRKDSPEYREFLAKGKTVRNGRVTATETGAKRMAQELGLEQSTRARRLVNRKRRELAAGNRERMS